MLLGTLLATHVAHAHPPKNRVYPNPEFSKDRFTWDEFYADNASERYEQNLNDCIMEDRRDRGIGEDCIYIPYNYCPRTAGDDLKNPRGVHRMTACIATFTHYWEERLETVYTKLIHHYESVDGDKPVEKQRVRQLSTVQVIWHDWREAKCDFLVDGQTYYAWIGAKYEACRHGLTARRALELEDLYSVKSD
jgi:uncharacterized protein YecT (DUF1311 family)